MRADVAALAADDPALHLVAGQLDQPGRRLARVACRRAAPSRSRGCCGRGGRRRASSPPRSAAARRPAWRRASCSTSAISICFAWAAVRPGEPLELACAGPASARFSSSALARRGCARGRRAPASPALDGRRASARARSSPRDRGARRSWTARRSPRAGRGGRRRLGPLAGGALAAAASAGASSDSSGTCALGRPADARILPVGFADCSHFLTTSAAPSPVAAPRGLRGRRARSLLAARSALAQRWYCVGGAGRIRRLASRFLRPGGPRRRRARTRSRAASDARAPAPAPARRRGPRPWRSTSSTARSSSSSRGSARRPRSASARADPPLGQRLADPVRAPSRRSSRLSAA